MCIQKQFRVGIVNWCHQSPEVFYQCLVHGTYWYIIYVWFQMKQMKKTINKIMSETQFFIFKITQEKYKDSGTGPCSISCSNNNNQKRISFRSKSYSFRTWNTFQDLIIWSIELSWCGTSRRYTSSFLVAMKLFSKLSINHFHV